MMLLSLIFSLSGLLVFSQPEESQSFKGKSVIAESDRQQLTFKVGKVQCDSDFQVSLELENKSGKDLDMKVYPSCTCTSLPKENLKVAAGKTLSFVFAVRAPGDPKENYSVYLQCVDKKADLDIVVVVLSEVLSKVEIEPKKLRFDSRVEKEFDLLVRSQFKRNKIKTLGLVGETGSLKVERIEDSGTRLIVKHTVGKGKVEDLDSFMLVSVKFVDETESLIKVPIEYSDKVRVSPSRAVFKEDSGRQIVSLLIAGQDAPTSEYPLIAKCESEVVGFESFELEIVSVRERAERMLVVVLAAPVGISVDAIPEDSFLTLKCASNSNIKWQAKVGVFKPN